MSHIVDWATLLKSTSDASSSYIVIGPLLACWGEFQATGIPTGAYGEKTFTINFPRAFSVRPQVIVETGDIGEYVGEYSLAHAASTTECVIVIGHVNSGSGTECRCGWVAIGAA